MKGILLAGGTGTRLWPATKVVSKQLLPVYDKPMIYYPLSTLMMADVRDILIITTPQDRQAFQELLGDGSSFGINIAYATQPKPEGLAQAFIIGEQFISNEMCMMILGDNIFHGKGLGAELARNAVTSGAHVFTYAVANPRDYGVLETDSFGNPTAISEKPEKPKSNLAVTGMYLFDSRVSEIAKNVPRSGRGEYEITSVIDYYLKRGDLSYTHLNRGSVWLDTGNAQSLSEASEYVRILELRTGLKIACLEEIAFRKGWINSQDLAIKAKMFGKNSYGKYLLELLA